MFRRFRARRRSSHSRLLPRFNDFHTANHFTARARRMFIRDDLLGNSARRFSSPNPSTTSSSEILDSGRRHLHGARAPTEQASESSPPATTLSGPTTVATGRGGSTLRTCIARSIEHPQWIPKETQAKYDLAPADKGRFIEFTAGVRSGGRSPASKRSMSLRSSPRSTLPAGGSGIWRRRCSCGVTRPPRSRRCKTRQIIEESPRAAACDLLRLMACRTRARHPRRRAWYLIQSSAGTPCVSQSVTLRLGLTLHRATKLADETDRMSACKLALRAGRLG